MSSYIQIEIKKSIAYLTLNRPRKHNAFNALLIQELKQAIGTLNQREDVRVVVICALGEHFCAGADLQWMHSMIHSSEAENQADGRELAQMFHALYHSVLPTIALVHGKTFGGGVGLVACCDIVLASAEARFCFSEVKLGLSPATIAPYVIRRIGVHHAKRYFISAEMFDANEAYRLHLVDEVLTESALVSRAQKLAWQIANNAPIAIKATKQLLNQLAPIEASTVQETSELIAKLRVSKEGQEGLSAFLEKRYPQWMRPYD